jgi:ATP synthase protein I
VERHPTEPSEDDEGEAARRRTRAYQAGTESVLAVPIALGLGWWADRKLGTSPFGLLIGLGFGFATFILRLLRMRGIVEREGAEAQRRKEEAER